jgi:spore maturation protein CgeB
MNILYVGELSSLGSTCLARMKEIEALGHTVFPVDDYPFQKWLGKLGFPFRRLRWGPQLSALNREILRQATRRRPEVVWVDKGVWVYPETLRALRERFGPFLVHYTPDPALVYHQSRHFVACVPLYDLIVTTKSYELKEYQHAGARHLYFQQQGFDHNVLKPTPASEEEQKRYGADIAFIGHWERERQRLAERLAPLGFRFAIWGPTWRRQCAKSPLLKNTWRGGFLGGRDYALSWCCSKIGLGLLSKLVPDQSTTRTIEIAACGTFVLTERTGEQLELFQEGNEAEFFSSDDECVEKVRYYMAHEDARSRIAAAGRARCMKSGYSFRDRMSEVLKVIEGKHV